ncbi:TPA: TetR/AcrR family transcriptional regulator [Pseudomonas aeruginosa]
MELDTRRKIISAASACFSEKGFRGTSIGDIARRANVSQGATYTYFDGKDELIVAIVEEEMKAALAAYTEPYECSSLERICELAKTCVMKTGYPVNPSLWIEILAESARHESVNTCFLAADVAMRNALKGVIRDGIERGEFKGVDPEEASILLFAILDGLIARRATNPDFNIDQHLPSFSRTLCSFLNTGNA